MDVTSNDLIAMAIGSSESNVKDQQSLRAYFDSLNLEPTTAVPATAEMLSNDSGGFLWGTTAEALPKLHLDPGVQQILSLHKNRSGKDLYDSELKVKTFSHCFYLPGDYVNRALQSHVDIFKDLVPMVRQKLAALPIETEIGKLDFMGQGTPAPSEVLEISDEPSMKLNLNAALRTVREDFGGSEPVLVMDHKTWNAVARHCDEVVWRKYTGTQLGMFDTGGCLFYLYPKTGVPVIVDDGLSSWNASSNNEFLFAIDRQNWRMYLESFPFYFKIRRINNKFEVAVFVNYAISKVREGDGCVYLNAREYLKKLEK